MKEIDEINEKLAEQNMLKIKLVNPKKCIGQKVNARYFPAETMHRLTSNVKNSGHLESVPLVYEEDGKDYIISGHHRVQAAKDAGLQNILVMVAQPEDKDDIVSKQLAHNELTGIDDKTILSELFNSIKDISKKISTGLDDSISKIDYTSLNFRIGEFKEFTVLFMPEDEGYTDEVMDEIAESINIKSKAAVRLTNVKYWDRFAKAIRTIKKCENIKSNGTAFIRMVELAEQMMERESTQNAHIKE
tara:strand:+ start:7793 stop:8530 length:738 start_codon:yes stop_codon:yes gene_type:complete